MIHNLLYPYTYLYMLYPRHTGGAVPLRFLVKTAIIAVTPPVVFIVFPHPSHLFTAVEPPQGRRRVASLHFRDCTAVVGLLRRHSGDGGAAVVLVRCHGGHGGAAATPLRISPTRDDTAEVLNMLKNFHRATAKVRGFDSFQRCYGDQ